MEKKNKTTAALLAFFVGGLGIHKFYLRENTAGILYLVFCWTAIPGILALTDAIILLTMTDEAFNEKYNSEVEFPMSNRTTANVNVSSQSSAQTLLEYKQLLDDGVITQDEFNAIKAKILG